MANENNEWEQDNEFGDDNDDEFNEDGAGWTDSDENVANDNDNEWEQDPSGWPSDDDLEQDAATEIENEFWKGYYENNDHDLALQSFLKVIELISNGGDDRDYYKFKSLTEIVILYFKNNSYENTIKYYKQFLLSSKSVRPNDLSSNLRKILLAIKKNEAVYNDIFDLTMKQFKPNKNEKISTTMKHLWFDLGIERCHDFMDQHKLKNCQILIDEIHENLDDEETAKLLQVYAVKIQLTMRLIEGLANDDKRDENEYNRLQLLLHELISVTRSLIGFGGSRIDVIDNKSMSLIYECWAKAYASTNDWSGAYKYFKESFLLYQQIADKNTTKCLKYLLISYMILSSLPTDDGKTDNIPNPFAMDEIKVYQNHHDIITMNNLVNSFENDDIESFNKYKKQQYDADTFIVSGLSFVQLRLQGKALINLVGSYDRVKLEWLCYKLGMTLDCIEKLIVKLIIDNELNGRLDQVNMILILKEKDNKQNKILNSLDSWLKSINNLRSTINGRAVQKLSQSFGGTGSGKYGFGSTDYLFGNEYEDDLYTIDSEFLSWQ